MSPHRPSERRHHNGVTGNGDNGEVGHVGPYMGQVLTEVFAGESAARRPSGRHRRPKALSGYRKTEVATPATQSGRLSRWLRGLAPARRSWQRQPNA